jgi:hypothetical protein
VPANRGAGGKGLLGLPPYCDDGVPGRGLPLISAGSYETVEAGGLFQSDRTRVGVAGRDPRSGDIFRETAIGGGITGVCPKLELVLELSTVDAPGLRYLSGGMRRALNEGLGLVFGLLLSVTVALMVGA